MAGTSLNNRKLSSDVRTKLLLQCQAILDGTDELAKKELLFKMCTTLLPRLNEHAGEDGEAIKITISKDIADKYEVPLDTITSSAEQDEV